MTQQMLLWYKTKLIRLKIVEPRHDFNFNLTLKCAFITQCLFKLCSTNANNLDINMR